MNIKVQCTCQTKFEFEVEPVQGRMPCEVACPQCGADATAAANAVMQANLSASVRPAVAVVAAGPGPAYCPKHPDNLGIDECRVCGKPICQECLRLFGFVCSVYCRNQAQARGLEIPVYAQQADVVARKQERRTRRLATLVALCVLALLGAWIWYAFFGSKPKVIWSRSIPKEESGSWCRLAPPSQLVLITPKTVTLHDLPTGRALWSSPLSAGPNQRNQPAAKDDSWWWSASDIQAHVTKEDVWVVLADRVARLERKTGQARDDVRFSGPLRRASFHQDALLVESGDFTSPVNLTLIELAGGKPVSEQIPRAPAARRTLGNQSGNALPDLDAPDPTGQFILTGPNVVQMQLKLLESKTVTREVMQPKGPSDFESGKISGVNRGKIANEIINDMRRDATGGVEEEDASVYQVTLTRRLPAAGSAWTGTVTGLPQFFPGRSVDVLVASRALTVFDKQNHRLWEAKLSNPVGRWGSDDLEDEVPAAPFLESGSALFFYDQGTLTAFDLNKGEVRWRLNTVGIAHVAADARGMLYVVSSTANPDSLRHPGQIDLSKKINPLLSKVDPASGKVLWQVEGISERCQLSGPYVYTTRAQISGAQLIGANGDIDAIPVHHRVYRLDPKTGREVWAYYRPKAPLQTEMWQNYLMLRYRSELRVLKFLTF